MLGVGSWQKSAAYIVRLQLFPVSSNHPVFTFKLFRVLGLGHSIPFLFTISTRWMMSLHSYRDPPKGDKIVGIRTELVGGICVPAVATTEALELFSDHPNLESFVVEERLNVFRCVENAPLAISVTDPSIPPASFDQEDFPLPSQLHFMTGSIGLTINPLLSFHHMLIWKSKKFYQNYKGTEAEGGRERAGTQLGSSRCRCKCMFHICHPMKRTNSSSVGTIRPRYECANFK